MTRPSSLTGSGNSRIGTLIVRRSELQIIIGRELDTLSPLRERPDDIVPLSYYFLKSANEGNSANWEITDEALAALCAYSWPGNVRELKNCLERAAILTEGDLVEPAHLHFSPPATTPCTGEAVSINLRIPSAEFSLDRVVDQTLDFILNRCQGNKSRAATLLKVDRKLFYRRT